MRRVVVLIALAWVATGCGFFRKTFGVSDSSPAHQEPTTTSIYGDWVLASESDATAFAGAQRVELALQPGTFQLRAVYPQGDVVVNGTAGIGEAGLLMLTPSKQTGEMASSWRALAMRPGVTVAVLASAAGGSLVFAPDEQALRPSSVWHRRDQAVRAGTVDTTQRRPPRQ